MSSALAKQQWIEAHLKPGEVYAGLMLGLDGGADYHLVLLPGELTKGNWAAAKEFAASVGGKLPSRREQRVLFANVQAAFEKDWYWSSEQHAAYADYAWFQYFDDGNQTNDYESASLRARAVRRFAI